jgi:transcriptional regulator with XRE-family HTH domain
MGYRMSEYRRGSRAAAPGLAQDPDAIWRARKLAGLTQEQLAGKTGIAASKISEIETGRLSASPSKLASLAAALGVPVGQLENRGNGQVEPRDVEAEQDLLRQLVGMYPLVAAQALTDALAWLPADPPGHDPAAISWLRQRAGLSREALAAACGVSVNRIRNLEDGGPQPTMS